MSEQIRGDVWVSLLDAEHNTRYYSKQLEKHTKAQRAVEAVLVTCGGAGLLSLSGGLPPPVLSLCVIASAMASIYSRIRGHAGKAAHLNSIRRDCAALQLQWENLWSRVQDDAISDDDALAENSRLKERLQEVTRIAPIVGLVVDEKVSKTAWVEAIQLKEGQYYARVQD